MVVSILSNSSAAAVQGNLAAAQSASQSSISKLSSGQAIIRASDDVAGLAVGTVLATNVSTLRTVLTNTSQASSLLQIADGGAKGISDILQRQKALSTQASSGTLSDTERAFLNEEFAALTDQITQTVASTKFNSVTLLDGSIFDKADVDTKIADKGASASITLEITGTVSDGDSILLKDSGGTTRQLVFSQDGGGPNAIALGGATATSAVAQANLEAYLQSATDEFFQQFTFSTFSSDSMTITAKNTGTDGNSFSLQILNSTGEAIPTNIGINGVDPAATAVSFSGGTNGDLYKARTSFDTTNASIGDSILTAVTTDSLVYASGQLDFDDTVTQGDVVTIGGVTFTFGSNIGNLAIAGDAADDAQTLVDAINRTLTDVVASYDNTGDGVVTLTALEAGSGANTIVFQVAGTGITGATGGGTLGDSASDAGVDGTGGGIYVNNVVNNDDFVGIISGFKATYISSDNISASITVGDITYTASITDTTPAADTFIRFESEKDGTDGGGFFDIQLASGGLAVADQDGANTFASRLDAAFSTINFFQQRDVKDSSFVSSGDIFNGTTKVGTLGGASADFKLDGFTNATLKDITFTAPVSGGNGSVTFELSDGTKFSNTSVSGGTVTTNATLTLTNTANSNEEILITFGSTAASGTNAIDFSTAGNAAAVETAFETAFGLGVGGGGLGFQVGITSSESITVAIESLSTSNLYKDDDGLTTALSISTKAGAEQAAAILDNAINKLSSVRATIGALQSRFNFASASIQSAIQNTDAARADFLDADIANESTAFATAQVKLQASISVLAQANQLPQNLLKLIG